MPLKNSYAAYVVEETEQHLAAICLRRRAAAAAVMIRGLPAYFGSSRRTHPLSIDIETATKTAKNGAVHHHTPAFLVHQLVAGGTDL